MTVLKFSNFASQIQSKAQVIAGQTVGKYCVGFQTNGYVQLVPVDVAVQVALIRASKLTRDEHINCSYNECEWAQLVTDVQIMSDHWNTWQELIDDCVHYAFGYEDVAVYRVVPNRAQCLICNDIIESKSRHDFVECGCGNLFVDGGLDYQRTGWTQDLSSFRRLDWPKFD